MEWIIGVVCILAVAAITVIFIAGAAITEAGKYMVEK